MLSLLSTSLPYQKKKKKKESNAHFGRTTVQIKSENACYST